MHEHVYKAMETSHLPIAVCVVLPFLYVLETAYISCCTDIIYSRTRVSDEYSTYVQVTNRRKCILEIFLIIYQTIVIVAHISHHRKTSNFVKFVLPTAVTINFVLFWDDTV
jgi:hypothetical protein